MSKDPQGTSDKEINEQLAQLLGLGNTPVEWPYSEKALIELIHLQREKEITKQHYFRVENLNKTSELLNRCLSVQMPPLLIPAIFSGDIPSDEILQRLMTSAQVPTSNTPVHLPPTPQRQPMHQQPPVPPVHPLHQSQQQQQSSMQSPSRPLYAGYPQQPPHPSQQQQSQQQQQQPPFGNLGPPVSFQPQTQRPHSPAKIGAAAVAQLERGRYPSSPMHKRTMSTPVFHHHHQPPQSLPQIQIQSPAQPQKQGAGMMSTMNSIQFINENPGRKRRRDSRGADHDDEGEATEDEPNDEEKNEKPVEKRKIRHARTRSDHFVYDSSKNKENEKEPNKVAAVVKKFEEGSITPNSGPKFANNILSSA